MASLSKHIPTQRSLSFLYHFSLCPLPILGFLFFLGGAQSLFPVRRAYQCQSSGTSPKFRSILSKLYGHDGWTRTSSSLLQNRTCVYGCYRHIDTSISLLCLIPLLSMLSLPVSGQLFQECDAPHPLSHILLASTPAVPSLEVMRRPLETS